MSAEPPRAGSSIDDDTVVGPIRNRPLRSHSRASLAVINPMSPYGFGEPGTPPTPCWPDYAASGAATSTPSSQSA
jgi:hypothetical protein